MQPRPPLAKRDFIKIHLDEKGILIYDINGIIYDINGINNGGE